MVSKNPGPWQLKNPGQMPESVRVNAQTGAGAALSDWPD